MCYDFLLGLRDSFLFHLSLQSLGGYVTDEELELRLEDESKPNDSSSSSHVKQQLPPQQQQQLQAPPKPPRAEDLQSPSKEVLIADNSSRRSGTFQFGTRRTI